MWWCVYKLAYWTACHLFLGEERRSVHCVAGCAPLQLRKEQAWARVQFSLEHLPRLKLRQISFPLRRGTRRWGPARLVRAFLAGPLEYKEHSEVLWEADRHREQ